MGGCYPKTTSLEETDNLENLNLSQRQPRNCYLEVNLAVSRGLMVQVPALRPNGWLIPYLLQNSDRGFGRAEPTVEEQTWRIFWRVAVRKANSRVLRCLKEAVGDLIE
jgi:hypothetical protein